MKLRFKGIIFLVLLTFLVSLQISSAQVPPTDTLRATWISLAGQWIWLAVAACLFLILGGIIVRSSERAAGTAGTNWIMIIGEALYIVGLILTFIALFSVEATLFNVLGQQPIINYVACQGVFTTGRSGSNGATDVLDMIACTMSGYLPTYDYYGYGIYISYTTFFLFGVVFPLALLIALAYWSLDFVHQRNVKNVIAFSIGMIAFRGFFVSLFIEFLTFGIVGVMALIVNMLLIMMLWRWLVKLIGFSALIAQEQNLIYLAELDRLLEDEERAIRAMSIAQPGGPAYTAARDELDDIRQRLRDVRAAAAAAGAGGT